MRGPAHPDHDLPAQRRRSPVGCPRCGTPVTTRAEMVVHLVDVHDEQLPRRRKPRQRRAALGRDPRSKLARELDRIPMLLVVGVNFALGIITIGVLFEIEPAWWLALAEGAPAFTEYMIFVAPTIAYLFRRDIC